MNLKDTLEEMKKYRSSMRINFNSKILRNEENMASYYKGKVEIATDFIRMVENIEQPQLNQWHVVADGDLPGNNEDYYKMKCFVDMKHIYSESSFRDVLWFNNGCWKWENGKKISDKYTVIAWQPFAYPQPYKERD